MQQSSATQPLVSIADLVGDRKWRHLFRYSYPAGYTATALCGITVTFDHDLRQRPHSLPDHCPDCLRVARIEFPHWR